MTSYVGLDVAYADSRPSCGGAAIAAVLAVAALALASLFLLLAAGSLAGIRPAAVDGATGVAGIPAGVAGIPPRYLALYLAAARRYGLDWAVLAAIGEVECDHGRDPDPSCTREGAANAAGAGGPAQFLASSWRQYGVDADGDGVADRWDPADAIYAMARFLRACGAPSDYRRAIFAYNHAGWYVAEVERWASRYRSALADRADGAAAATGGGGAPVGAAGDTVRFVAGTRATLSPLDGHLALVPAGAPPQVQAMVMAGNELQDLPMAPTAIRTPGARRARIARAASATCCTGPGCGRSPRS